MCAAATSADFLLYSPTKHLFFPPFRLPAQRREGTSTHKREKQEDGRQCREEALTNVCNNLNQWIRKSILQHSVQRTQTSTQWEQSSTGRRAAVESRSSGTAAHIHQDGDAQATRPRPDEGLPGVGWHFRTLWCCSRNPKRKRIIGSEEPQTQTSRYDWSLLLLHAH